MRLCLFGLLTLGSISWAQLTTDQKISDFEQMAGLFAKGYGPHEWKKQAFGIDLFNTAPWIQRVRATKDDLEFVDVMSEWVAQLNDAHDGYANTSNFSVDLGFVVDIYDGRLLVDIVDRVRVDPTQYPIANGYELVSIDGEDANTILERYQRYAIAANTRSTRRLAAELITFRPQWIIPLAHLTPEASTVVFRRYDGGLETYRMPWKRNGTPLTKIGLFPNLTTETTKKARSTTRASIETLRDEFAPVATDVEAAVIEAADRMLRFALPGDRFVRGFGATAPIFVQSLPGTFLQRLGRSSSEPFFTGTFQAGGYRIGFVRIPSFAPSDLNAAVMLFAREIAFFRENTDGLIIDIMRNPGGSSSYANALMSYLMSSRWRTLGVEVRATSSWIRDMSSTIESLRAQGAPPSILRGFEDALEALREANRSDRGLTRPIPWDFSANLERDPIQNAEGIPLAYNKSLIVLTDELSASAADGFAAMIQDNARGPLFGWRTMGAGGNVVGFLGGTYAFGSVSLTQSLMSRAAERTEPGYPTTRYVENVGVHPDIQVDYMTRDNLFQNGKPFVDAFVSAIVDHIEKTQ